MHRRSATEMHLQSKLLSNLNEKFQINLPKIRPTTRSEKICFWAAAVFFRFDVRLPLFFAAIFPSSILICHFCKGASGLIAGILVAATLHKLQLLPYSTSSMPGYGHHFAESEYIFPHFAA